MKFTGGIRFGSSYFDSVNGSWPFASLQIEPGRILLSGLSKKFAFTAEDRIHVSKYRGLFSKGIRFEHANSEYAPFLIFWTFSQRAVIAALTKAGFDVAEQSRARG